VNKIQKNLLEIKTWDHWWAQ